MKYPSQEIGFLPKPKSFSLVYESFFIPHNLLSLDRHLSVAPAERPKRAMKGNAFQCICSLQGICRGYRRAGTLSFFHGSAKRKQKRAAWTIFTTAYTWLAERCKLVLQAPTQNLSPGGRCIYAVKRSFAEVREYIQGGAFKKTGEDISYLLCFGTSFFNQKNSYYSSIV